MPSEFEEFLTTYYDELRVVFLNRTRLRTPPELAGELDDIFQEWCVEQLQYWQKNDPPDFWKSLDRDAAFRAFFLHGPSP